jgi:hypothetical protein
MPNRDGTGPRNGFGRGLRRGLCRDGAKRGRYSEEKNNDFCNATRRHIRRSNNS